MREIERRITKLERGVYLDPFRGLDEEYFAAFEREELRRSFDRIMVDFADEHPEHGRDVLDHRSKLAEQDKRLRELIGGDDTPTRAAADSEIVWRWEAARSPEERQAAHRRQWPGRPSFDELMAEYQALCDAQQAAAAQPALHGETIDCVP